MFKDFTKATRECTIEDIIKAQKKIKNKIVELECDEDHNDIEEGDQEIIGKIQEKGLKTNFTEVKGKKTKNRRIKN